MAESYGRVSSYFQSYRISFNKKPQRLFKFRKLRTTENVARYMSNKSRLKGTFDRQHGKRVQTLLRSGQQHCYHIY